MVVNPTSTRINESTTSKLNKSFTMHNHHINDDNEEWIEEICKNDISSRRIILDDDNDDEITKTNIHHDEDIKQSLITQLPKGEYDFLDELSDDDDDGNSDSDSEASVALYDDDDEGLKSFIVSDEEEDDEENEDDYDNDEEEELFPKGVLQYSPERPLIRAIPSVQPSSLSLIPSVSLTTTSITVATPTPASRSKGFPTKAISIESVKPINKTKAFSKIKVATLSFSLLPISLSLSPLFLFSIPS